MSRVKLLFTLVFLAFFALLVQAISGFILWLVLPRGDGRGVGAGDSTFIWGRGVWLDIHKWTAVALLAIIAIHIYMHRKWIYKQIRSLFGFSFNHENAWCFMRWPVKAVRILPGSPNGTNAEPFASRLDSPSERVGRESSSPSGEPVNGSRPVHRYHATMSRR